jgi:hypothetical protein
MPSYHVVVSHESCGSLQSITLTSWSLIETSFSRMLLQEKCLKDIFRATTFLAGRPRSHPTDFLVQQFSRTCHFLLCCHVKSILFSFGWCCMQHKGCRTGSKTSSHKNYYCKWTELTSRNRKWTKYIHEVTHQFSTMERTKNIFKTEQTKTDLLW